MVPSKLLLLFQGGVASGTLIGTIIIICMCLYAGSFFFVQSSLDNVTYADNLVYTWCFHYFAAHCDPTVLHIASSCAHAVLLHLIVFVRLCCYNELY